MMQTFEEGIEKMLQMTCEGHDRQCLAGRVGVGMLFDHFDNYRSMYDDVIGHAALGSGMLNRVYAMLSDGNCFAVTVTVSPCRTNADGQADNSV